MADRIIDVAARAECNEAFRNGFPIDLNASG